MMNPRSSARSLTFLVAFLVGICCISLAARCDAEADTASPPSPPFLARLPVASGWTMTPAAPAPAGEESDDAQRMREFYFPVLESVTSYKDEGIIHEIRQWRNQGKTEGFILKGTIFRASSPRYPDDVLIIEGDPESDFPDFLWLDEKAYQGVMPSPKGPLYLFESAGRKLLVDARTRLPVRYEENGKVFLYHFFKGKKRPVKIPAAFQAIMDQYWKARQ